MTPKSPFEINWPLNKVLSLSLSSQSETLHNYLIVGGWHVVAGLSKRNGLLNDPQQAYGSDKDHKTLGFLLMF
jgi:hypothetical protein